MNDKKDEVVKEIEIKVGRLENLTKIKKLYIIMCIFITSIFIIDNVYTMKPVLFVGLGTLIIVVELTIFHFIDAFDRFLYAGKLLSENKELTKRQNDICELQNSMEDKVGELVIKSKTYARVLDIITEALSKTDPKAKDLILDLAKDIESEVRKEEEEKHGELLHK